MNSITVLVDAKKEYTMQLQQIISPQLYEGFKSIYNDILNAVGDEIIKGNKQSSSVIKIFQKSLKICKKIVIMEIIVLINLAIVNFLMIYMNIKMEI